MMPVRAQFIAGTRCPSCGVEDRLQLCREAGDDGVVVREWVRCVSCDYRADAPEILAPPEYPTEAASVPVMDVAAAPVRWTGDKS